MENLKIILASASPRRKQLLQLITNDFEIIVPGCEEILPENISPFNAAVYLSQLKCKAVYNSLKEMQNPLVIGADTTVILQGKILGKPENENHGIEMLKSLSGKTHSVITGVTLGYCGNFHSFSCETKVTFNTLTEEEILNYIKSGEPMDKAGSYGIQGRGALFVREIKGDFYNVVGLPVSRLNLELKNLINQNNSSCSEFHYKDKL